ncbi:PqiB family protein [Pollutimonas bauzanensis]|uniref:Paraquat-inducible protein B n=1 Tax=Pollutimonas bauzanensis TaxID=658167 RepID=A0A1M5XWW9_9BURK|nr:MlaD family protein [Pollutimonas bauzanensis]SHI03733.1 paraquat-inducible protein B [Pollutimonas bauzanensis]
MSDHNTAPESSSSAPGDAAGPATPGLRQPDVKAGRESRFSWIWLVPLVAALVGVSLLVRNWMHTGPTVTISFESADGLEVGQTKVRYKDVVIGLVTDIKVAPDRSKVLVDAELNREGSAYITQEGTRFWVVRPRLGISGVSGLGTLLSGAYIGVDAAESKNGGEPVYQFTGLEKPPEVTSGRPGTRFNLRASELGSLEIGSPVYFRRIQVGQIIGYDLDKSGKAVSIQVFIDKPNDKFVTKDTRFWNASGINVSLSADGFNVQTGSIVSVMAGGVAFAAPDDADTQPADADQAFLLADTQAHAMADPDGPALPISMQFRQSVRGLKVGAPIDFRGLELGKVVDIDLEFNTKEKYFYALVKGELYPLRFGSAYQNMLKHNADSSESGADLLGVMVERGLRAQMRAANLLTGQQYIALEFFPDAKAVAFDAKAQPPLLPTIAGDFDRLQQQISSIVAKIDTIPFEGIGNDLRASLKSVSKLVDRLDGQVAPQASAVLKAAQKSLGRVDKLLAQDSPMNDNLDRTLREISAAAKSLRALADYLQTHPTALLRGPARDAMPASP